MIGITGGIGSGKSTIARALAQRGYTVYDCDKEAKRIIISDTEVQKAITDLLGEEAFSTTDKGLQYNIGYVAGIVFRDEEKRKALNAIVHPAVGSDILHVMPDFVESAILFDADLDTLCEYIIIVDAPMPVRVYRTIARDYNGIASPENIAKVNARIRTQRDYESTIGPNILHINNDGNTSIAELAEICTKLAEK